MVILDPEDEIDDLPSLSEYGFSGTDNPMPNPSLQVKATQGCSSAYFSGHNKTSSSKTKDQEQSQKLFKPNSYRIQDEPAPKRKSVADISINWATKTQTKPVPHPQTLSSRLQGWGDLQAAKRPSSNMESATILKFDGEVDGGRKDYVQVKRKNGATGGAIPKRSLSLSSKVPGWNEFKAMKNVKSVEDQNNTEDTGLDPDLGNQPSKLEQEVAGVK